MKVCTLSLSKPRSYQYVRRHLQRLSFQGQRLFEGIVSKIPFFAGNSSQSSLFCLHSLAQCLSTLKFLAALLLVLLHHSLLWMLHRKTSSSAFLLATLPPGKDESGCGHKGSSYSRVVSITLDSYSKEAKLLIKC